MIIFYNQVHFYKGLQCFEAMNEFENENCQKKSIFVLENRFVRTGNYSRHH